MEWKEKILGESGYLKFHRKNINTENTMAGYKSSNQLDRIEGLLKDEPSKVSLRGRMAEICSIPPFQVVSQPSVDTQARKNNKPPKPAIENEFEDFNIGFAPGEDGKSLNVDFITRHDYNRQNYPIKSDFK